MEGDDCDKDVENNASLIENGLKCGEYQTLKNIQGKSDISDTFFAIIDSSVNREKKMLCTELFLIGKDYHT